MCSEVMHKADDQNPNHLSICKKISFLINLKEVVVWLLLFLTEIFTCRAIDICCRDTNHLVPLLITAEMLSKDCISFEECWECFRRSVTAHSQYMDTAFYPSLVCQASIVFSMFYKGFLTQILFHKNRWQKL